MKGFFKGLFATLIIGSLFLLCIPEISAQVGTLTRRLIGTQDISWATGGTGAVETFSYVDPSGHTLTLNKPDATNLKFRTSLWGIARSVDSIVPRLQYEIWVGDPLYPTFTAAVATLNSAGTSCTLRLPAGTYTISSDLTINANILLKADKGVVFAIATTKTMTINGHVEAGLYQIFSCTGTGKVVLPAAVAKVPEWWGAAGNGVTDDAVPLQAWATCGGNLQVPKKTFNTSVGIIVPANAVIDGQGTIKQTVDTVEGLILNDDVTVRNISVTGSAVAYGGPNYHVGIIAYSIRNGSSNNPATCALSAWVSGNRMKIDNVKFTGWNSAVWMGLDSIVQNCKATNNWREAFYAGGTGCRVINNEIDGCDSWAIDFNGGDSVASHNNIKNCGRVLVDGGGIVFAGMTTEKPMTKLTAIGNTVNDAGVGFGIYVLSKATDGIVSDVVISNNTLIGKGTGVSVAALTVYPGGGVTTPPMKNITVTGNVAQKWKYFIDAYHITRSSFSGNIGHTFAPPTKSAMAFGAVDRTLISNNICADVTGASPIVIRIEGANNYNQIINNFCEGTIGFENVDSSGVGNTIAGNDLSRCTTPYNAVVALAMGNVMERNLGYPTSPAVPATTVEQANTNDFPVKVTVNGATVTAIAIGPSGATVATGATSGTFILQPGWAIKLTYTAFADVVGDVDGTTATITGLASTAGFSIGGTVTVSAGFPAVPLTVVSKTATTLTLSVASTSAQSNVTTTQAQPSWIWLGI